MTISRAQVSDTERPLVSVIIPAYCAAPYLERAVNSVRGQTHSHIEIIIVDDGSTDDTLAIAAGLAEKDERIKVLHQSRGGAVSARQLAAEHASGKYIAPIDSDDLWAPQNLRRQVDCLEENPEVAVSYAWSVHIDEDDRPRGRVHAYRIDGDVYVTLLSHFFLGNGSCSVIRRSCLEAVGSYSRAFYELGATGCEDWELYLRLADQYPFKAVPEFLVCYRTTLAGASANCESMAHSHELLLGVAERRERVPSFVRRLSTSSFYLHFAHMCSDLGRDAEGRKWISRAIKADPILSSIRLDLYLLLLRTVCPKQTRAARSSVSRVTPINRALNTMLSRFPRTAMGSGLHRFMQMMFPHRFEQDAPIEPDLVGSSNRLPMCE